ncbi:MAG: hypothetical protein ABSA47_08090 [Verrucomicrobiota bacterium]|jgi:hypothetical protein
MGAAIISTFERARRYVAKCPPSVSGQAGHNAAFHVAAVLVHGFALPENDALSAMLEWNQVCLPPWSKAELIHKLRSAAGAQHSLPRGHLLGAGPYPTSASPLPSTARGAMPRKPEFCPMVLRRVAAKVTVPDFSAALRAASPVPVDPQDSAGVLRCLYGHLPGEKVLVFSNLKTQGEFLWEANRAPLARNSHLPAGPDGVWFLPQPVDGQFHPNPRGSGKMSRRSAESVTSWRYLVLESDQAPSDLWLRCLVQIPLPIASICESGRRSIHALVRVDAATKADWDSKLSKMKHVLVTLGADPGALSAVRLTRLPQAMRGPRLQRLLYLNPDPDGRPIADSWKGHP